MSSSSNTFLADVRRIAQDVLSAALDAAAVPDSAILAAETARKLAAEIQFEWAGQQVYIRLNGPLLAQRIFDDYTGDNIDELVRRYRLSTKQIYRILAAERRRRTGRRNEQATLPGI